MFPIRDNIPSDRPPIINIVIIGICTVAFALQLWDETDQQADLIESFGMVPLRVLHPDASIQVPVAVMLDGRLAMQLRELPDSPIPQWLTLVTCIFLHGGWMHFLGNMWFLWIFGDNVEDRLGHVGYLLFYVGSGVAASAAHLIVNADSPVPTIGASGAIAGVMGAYMVLYPRAQVLAAIPIVVILQIMVVPAPLFLGIWFLLQFFQGTMAISTMQTGVAWWAHIGGFVIGGLAGLIVRLLHPEDQQPYEQLRRRPAHAPPPWE